MRRKSIEEKTIAGSAMVNSLRSTSSLALLEGVLAAAEGGLTFDYEFERRTYGRSFF